jgi:hypothetical protein
MGHAADSCCHGVGAQRLGSTDRCRAPALGWQPRGIPSHGDRTLSREIGSWRPRTNWDKALARRVPQCLRARAGAGTLEQLRRPDRVSTGRRPRGASQDRHADELLPVAAEQACSSAPSGQMKVSGCGSWRQRAPTFSLNPGPTRPEAWEAGLDAFLSPANPKPTLLPQDTAVHRRESRSRGGPPRPSGVTRYNAPLAE